MLFKKSLPYFEKTNPIKPLLLSWSQIIFGIRHLEQLLPLLIISMQKAHGDKILLKFLDWSLFHLNLRLSFANLFNLLKSIVSIFSLLREISFGLETLITFRPPLNCF
jgi:hypothetical protein